MGTNLSANDLATRLMIDRQLRDQKERKEYVRRQKWLKRLGYICHRAWLVEQFNSSEIKDVRIFNQIVKLDRSQTA